LFKGRGVWKEPYGEFDFYGLLQARLIHTTFFLKDYELLYFTHLFGKGLKELRLEQLKRYFEAFPEVVKGHLKAPKDHYLSTFILFFSVEKLKLNPKEIESFYRKKSLRLGFKGFYQYGAVVLENGQLYGHPELLKFLRSPTTTPLP
jgi:hypothetical protein